MGALVNTYIPSKETYQDFLIVRLGGLHTLRNVLKVTGQHILSSELMDAWVESKLMDAWV